jgi:SpoIID/LytB domain protein
LPLLSDEAVVRRWIESEPQSYCATNDNAVLSQILNGYDRETNDFYRWRVEYTQEELSAIVAERSGIDFGEILDLVPIKRGPSARLYEMQIVGSKRTMVIGKELEIRKWLSKSHLYSSAFVVDRNEAGDFILTGAGWGHGVGLCQIGAAVMAAKGYTYEQILAHYFPGSKLEVI